MKRAAGKHHFIFAAVSTLAFAMTSVTGVFAHTAGNNTGTFTIVKVKASTQDELRSLINEGYEIAGVDLEAGVIDVIVNDATESMTLRFLGYEVTGQKVIDTTVAPDQNYKTPAEIADAVQGYARDYPGLVRIESIGKSHENRDIWAVRITDNPDQRELDEPTILFNGMHHAREIMTPEVALDTIELLLTSYGTDADITRWVDSTEIWVVPMLNPDGNNKVWTSSSMWRKNTRGGYGVDINRNYPYAWNTCNGSSGSTFSDTYRGPSAGSEPEVQALMGLVARIQPVFDISYHSYSELVIYPYGCNGQRTETRDVVEQIGRTLAGTLPRDSGSGTYAPGTAWELLYSVDGGDIDWMYNVHNVIPFVIEVSASSQGFQPPYSWRNRTVEKLRNGWKYLFQRLEGSGVRGVVTDGAGRTLPNAMVTIENLGTLKKTPVVWKVKADGTYHIVLNPGMYTLRFEHNGRVVTENVTIGESRTELNVQL